jgi:hypothetical protein
MKLISFITLVLLASPWVALAQTTQPSIALTTDVEDGKKMIQATVTLNGKPLANATLQYFVKRTFGNLLLGEDTTLDDGTSALAFPSDLPGSADAMLHVTVKIKTPVEFVAASASAVFAADLKAVQVPDEFPRALWAPDAPLSLMITIGLLLAAVWSSYFYVVTRIFAIRMKGAS